MHAHSLDDVYYFAGQHTHLQKALYDHEARPNSQEISFNTGDQIHTLGNHWDGYSKGINRRTKQEGLYPSYKVTEVVEDVQFPRFPGWIVDISRHGKFFSFSVYVPIPIDITCGQ